MKNIGYYIIIIAFTLGSCKTQKGITDTGKTKRMSIAKIVKKANESRTDFKTLRATLRLETVKNLEENKFTISLRLEKNKQIWMSFKKAGFSGGKALITPNNVQFYNKLDKEYFDGDFSLISKLLGTPLSFKQLQSVLLGESMFTLESSYYNKEILSDGYLLYPEQQPDESEHYITINPSNFKIKTQEISQSSLNRVLSIDYTSYQITDSVLWPLLMHVVIVENTKETQIDITYKNVSLNSEMRFPFTIPSGYKKIKID